MPSLPEMLVDGGGEITAQSMFDTLDRYNAGVVKLVIRDNDDRPLRALIAVQGDPDTAEVLAAVEGVEASWDDEGET